MIYVEPISICSKLRIFPYSEVIHTSKTFKLMKGQQRLKKNNQLLNLIFLFFNFLLFDVSDSMCHKQKWCMLFSTRIKLVACVLACVCDRMLQMENTALRKTSKLVKKIFTFRHQILYYKARRKINGGKLHNDTMI